MWYAVWVETGREETIKQYCKQYMDSSIYVIFLFLGLIGLKSSMGNGIKKAKSCFQGISLLIQRHQNWCMKHLNVFQLL